jgi:hypothetical protein
VDEELDDLLLRHARVQRYPYLPGERFVGAERCGDGDRDERAAAVIEPAAGPRVAEGVDGGETPQVLSSGRLAITSGRTQNTLIGIRTSRQAMLKRPRRAAVRARRRRQVSGREASICTGRLHPNSQLPGL